MEPPKTPRDPRILLLTAIPVLFGLGLLVQAAWGPGPGTGYLINRSIELGQEGRLERSFRGLQVVVEERPRDAHAWMRAARALRLLGRMPEAAVYFRKAGELDPDSETIQFELARALLEAGLPGLAEEAVERTLELEPDHAGAYYIQAAVAASRGDADSAIPLVRRALDLGPAWPDRYRADPLFDPVRNDLRFVETVRSRRVPGAFQDD